ncbi:MAG: SpoIIE family protein phosphatase, partial [Deltaproteobacteria bacterium]|nr:SpoIIE family protein phosphatase [Deltaproteobacteria bacterium]
NIHVDRENRSFRCQGVAGAMIRSGTVEDHETPGTGDCVVADFKNGFFAVADSSRRHKIASRKFLLKISRIIEELGEVQFRTIFPVEAVKGMVQQLRERTESVLAKIPYTESCTFTGLLLVKSDVGLKGILLHAGDSLLFRDEPGGKLEQISETNFWMVGRSRKLYQSELIEVPKGATFILTTDGISDLAFSDYAARDACLVELIRDVEVEDIPDKLIEGFDSQPSPVDDLGFVILRPERIPPKGDRIIMGGTSEIHPLSIRLPALQKKRLRIPNTR